MPKALFRVTPRAKQDLHNIWDYTLDMWGEAQADRYIQDLFSRFERLAKQPTLGKHRPDVNDGYYSYPHQSHLVFYVIHDGGIDVIGVLHKKMDILNYFD